MVFRLDAKQAQRREVDAVQREERGVVGRDHLLGDDDPHGGLVGDHQHDAAAAATLDAGLIRSHIAERAFG